jgi:hypothetical protein
LVSELTPEGVWLGMLKLTSNILEEIKNGQKEDLEPVDRVVLVNQGKGGDFRLSENGVLMFCDRVYVPDVLELKRQILEGHRSSLSIHPGVTKMYQDLNRLFWWPGMKKMQPLFVPEWKWDNISMDFVGALPKTVKGFDSIWVIVDRLTKSAHFVPIKTSMSVAKLAEIYIDSREDESVSE